LNGIALQYIFDDNGTLAYLSLSHTPTRLVSFASFPSSCCFCVCVCAAAPVPVVKPLVGLALPVFPLQPNCFVGTLEFDLIKEKSLVEAQKELRNNENVK
jgi:hypothetical protein